MGLRQWARAALQKIPLAAPHINAPYWDRVRRNSHLKRREARRVSFRRYWRMNRTSAGLRYLQTRRARRRLVREWWVADGKYKKETA